jgi:hypothetical protein
MTNSLDFTAAEWDLLESAPMLAGLLVGDLVNPARWLPELYAVFNAAESMAGDSGSVLIRAVTERMLAREGDGVDLPVDLPANPPEARAYLITGCLQATRLVAQKAPAEAPAFRDWLLQLARKAAESSQKSGFLGFGKQGISAEEQAILHELATALEIAI